MVESTCIHLFSPNTVELPPFTMQSSTYFSFIFVKKQGDKETGISIITLSDKQIDAGKCLYQKTLEIDPLMHYPQLATYLALEGGMAVMDTLYNIDTIKPMDQVRFMKDDDIYFRMNRKSHKLPKSKRSCRLSTSLPKRPRKCSTYSER